MKNKKHLNRPALVIMLSVLGFFIFNSCGSAPGCWGEDKNSGIIQESVDVFCPPQGDQKQFVITSDSVFRKLFDSSCVVPTIDFDQYSVLGQYATGGCTMKLKRDVRSDASRKEYLYKVIARDCGLCKRMQLSFNWVKVPKLPEDWTVRFELKEK